MSKILVTAKVYPDLDGTACTLAYADYLNRTGKPAVGLIYGNPQSEVEYFTKEQGITISTQEDDGNGDYKGIILVDQSTMKGLPKAVIQDKVIEIIDHREGEPEKIFPKAKIQNDLIGAAATIVVERFIAADLQPQPDHAKLLYGAIFHNTLNLTSSNTTDRDKSAIKYLESQFGLSRDLVSGMFRYSSKLIFSDLNKALISDAKEFTISKSTTRVYQLVLWEFVPGEWSVKIAAAVGEVDRNSGYDCSFLNLIDLKTNTGYIYSANPTTQHTISIALNLTFVDSWAKLTPALLRKQILPLLKISG